MLAPLLLWLSLGLLVYIYAGYPALVWLGSRWRPLHVRKGDWDGPLSVVIVAHNEAQRLTAKLDGIFRADIASRILEVLVGSDGSDDETPDVLARYPDPRVRLIPFENRRGKPAVLNDLVPQCRSEIVVLMDARQEIEPTCLRRLTANFADDRVGVVSGELVFRTSDADSAVAEGIGAYWTYEKFIRRCESGFRSVPGATGAIYALRRRLFRPIPERTLLDDVVIPMQAVEQGARCVFEAGAVAYDAPCQSARQESIRKRRTIAGCVQLVLQQPRWLLPWRNPIWMEYVSHKLLRLLSPLLLATALIATLTLLDRPAGRLLLVLQGAGYAAATIGWMFQRAGSRSSCFGPFLMFLTLNGTTLLALWDACRGRFRATWQRAS